MVEQLFVHQFESVKGAEPLLIVMIIEAHCHKNKKSTP
jgi:hypothetical protein